MLPSIVKSRKDGGPFYHSGSIGLYDISFACTEEHIKDHIYSFDPNAAGSLFVFPHRELLVEQLGVNSFLRK